MHPADGAPRHELYLMCDDIDATLAELRAAGAEVARDVSDQGWGLLAAIRLPDGTESRSTSRGIRRRWNDPRRRRVAADMTTVGFIGSGHIGGTVARLSVAAGHQVVLSNSRGPETLKDLAADLGPLARAATAAEAAQAGDLVVVSVPVLAFGQLPAARWRAG